MKTHDVLPLVLWGATVVLAATAARSIIAAIGRPAAGAVEQAPPPEAPGMPDRERLSGQAAELRDGNPFRLERTPTLQAFRLWDPDDPPQPAGEEAESRNLPSLSLGGVVGGPPWSAVIEGIPGNETGVLIRVGDESNGIRVEWVRNDSAAVSAQDTTWTLALKRLWHP